MFNSEDNEVEVTHQDKCKHISAVVDEYLEKLEYEYQNPDTPRGLCTGIHELDKKIDGFKGGDVILVGGRICMGKTSFAVNCAYNIANKFYEDAQNGKEQKHVLYFSSEMACTDLLRRMAGVCSGEPSWNYRKVEDYKQFEKNIKVCEGLRKLPLFIPDYVWAIEDFVTTISQYARNHKIGFIVVDYLSLLAYKYDYKTIKNRLPILEKIKYIAKCLDVPILVLAQLTRAPENRSYKRPLLSDFRELHGDCVDFGADIILMLYREYYYCRNNEPKLEKRETIEHLAKREEEWEKHCREIEYECDIIVAKNKYGATGTVKCFFDECSGKFDDKYLPLTDDSPF